MLTDRAKHQSRKDRVAPLRQLHATDRDDVLLVHEVYLSLQGEGTRAGERCAFVRLTGCHLRCGYCDTEHAFDSGVERPVRDVVDEVIALAPAHVLVTGGEPLLQRGTLTFIRTLLDHGLEVAIETSGGVSTRALDPRTVVILDVKTPSSGESARNVWSNLDRLRPHDEVKFVIGTEDDYAFACEVLRVRLVKDAPAPPCTILFSPVMGPAANCPGGLSPRDLVARMLRDRVPARLSLQIHKVIWGDQRGV